MKKLFTLLLLSFMLSCSTFAVEDWGALEEKANTELSNNNCKDAFLLYKKVILEYKATPRMYANALTSLKKARLENEFDSFFTAVSKKYGKKPEMAIVLARSKMRVSDYGYIIAGEFVRGNHRGGGQRVSCLERDRVEALRLLFGVLKNDRTEMFFEALSDIIMWGRRYNQAWKLQHLTDLNKLPDYEKRSRYFYGYRAYGAPVGADGKPIFYHVPESLKNSRNDGERWRWALRQIINDKKVSVYSKLGIKLKIANFLKSQFSVETIAYNTRRKIQSIKTGPYAIHLLKDDESIAKLASGLRKIKLPEDCNYIEMYKELIDTKYAKQGLGMLVRIYRNRRQYIKATNVLKEIIRIVRPKAKQVYIRELNQITGNWVELLDSKTFPAGVKPEVNLRFRNTSEISCRITKVKIETFIEDIKKNLRNAASRKEMFKLGYQPQQIGNWLLNEHGKVYLSDDVEEWDMDLEPLTRHFDKTIPLELPLSEAGVYFLEVTAKDGNTSRIIVWLTNTAIIERDANGGKLYIVTDALTGEPLDYCRMKFFGYKSKYIRDEKLRRKAGERYTFTFNEFFTQTDANGMIFIDAAKLKDFNKVMIEANVDDHFGVLGFSHLYYRRFNSQKMNQRRKIYAITDRPIYKPGQTVKFNYWLRFVGYGRDNFIGEFAGKIVKMTVRSPHKKLLGKEFRLDNFGAFNSSFKLPENADLGSYSISLDGLGGYIRFRVEEYRKPEYEVKVTMPEKALMLGNKIPISIKVDYLFGAPVVNAKVKYKVYRTAKSKFYMPFRWDWLYGPGVCKFSAGYTYRSWRSRKPTELVASNIGETDANGKLSFTIDTILAKALFDDEDSEYKVTAEVSDSSRYTEVGQGTVIAACKAFNVYCSTNKGFYRTGDVIDFSISAIDANNKKVSGKYTMDLFRIVYDDKKSPVEKKIKSWTGENPKIKFRLKKTGHYIARTKFTDKENHSISDNLIIRVIGKGVASPGKMTDMPLELITDKNTYQPGDSASIMINSADAGQSVYLFVRPASSGNPKNAKLIKLPAGSAVRELNIRPSDMPNVFIEALTVRNGRMYSVTKQIIVPPEKKILNIELKTAKNKYKPGKKCPLKIKITDASGKPVVGDVVLTVYDKALDLLSKGSNVPEINSFFWKWTRSWYMRARSSLDKSFYILRKKHELSMRPLGIFGNLIAPTAYEGAGGALRGMKTKSMALDSLNVSAPVAGKQSVVVRKNFADAVLWRVALKTDKNGMAELPIPLPDNLTTWKIRAWAMTDKCSVGQGESEVIVSKDYLVRLILPRFLTTGDTATLSAIVMNLGKQSGKAATFIKISGDSLRLLNPAEQKVELGANSEKRLDWQVQAIFAGKVAITVKSFCGENSDALELQLPIQIKGISKQVAASGYIKTMESASIIIDIPAKREEEATKLTINFSPSIATALVDALPYLINTNDKDIFSTINRFVPALIVQNTLKKMGINLAEIEKSKTNLNPVELGAKNTRAAGWKRFETNPVFSDERLKKIVARELTTIAGMQNSDGGWGWFSGFYERSGVYTTVKTVRALLLVKGVNKQMLKRGVAWLKAWQKRRIKDIRKYNYISNIDALVFDTLVKSGTKSGFMLKKLYAERAKLSINGLTLFASACQRLKDKTKLKMLLKNIEQFIVEDKENQTAYLRIPDNYWWWSWYGRDIDTQAAYLKLLAKIDPRGKRAAWLAKYILINRKHATYWTSVVDSGLCVEALCEFIQNSGEAKPDMNVEILFDGKVLKKVKINAGNMFNIENSIKLSGAELTSGKHKVEVRRAGKGTVYFNTYVSYFTMEDFIKRAGLDLKIKRQYFKLIPLKAQGQIRGSRGQALMMGVEKYKRIAIDDFTKILSGDTIEIEFTIESKNDYEYIIINDGKPAGFEALTVLSAYTQNNLGAFVEMRNSSVRFYVRRLARGKHSMSYRMRAVTPGKFTALPVIATGVYAPELRCNSNEFSISIR